ncbi:hypothetical protein MHBO_002769 [Bonamia ostreae]|uniref:Uncharacterized protein n=1 Tax=Bonamia ostreae TaxID=126728 RepID=A0ABV2AP73_9EUKA
MKVIEFLKVFFNVVSGLLTTIFIAISTLLTWTKNEEITVYLSKTCIHSKICLRNKFSSCGGISYILINIFILILLASSIIGLLNKFCPKLEKLFFVITVSLNGISVGILVAVLCVFLLYMDCYIPKYSKFKIVFR